MSAVGIATSSLIGGLRGPIASLQMQLVRAQTELSTGRQADVGLALGGRTTQAVSLHSVRAGLDAFTGGNATAAMRLTATQDALSTIRDTATTLQTRVIGALAGTATAQTITGDAQDALSSVIASLNTAAGGQTLFSSINTDISPMADGGSAGKQGIVDAFTAAFGIAPGDAGASSITPAAMRSFLDGAFAQRFDDASWKADWSSASDTPITTRIAPTRTQTTSVSANAPALRGVVQVAAMLSQLGLASLSAQTRQVILSQASDQVARAVGDLTSLQAAVGTTQTTVTAATDQMTHAASFVDTQIATLEGVDPAEVSTRIASLTTQLESAYTLTGKLAQLSLVRYLS